VTKRYQNRMRYLAARLRLQTHEPDRIDSLLHWLGRKLLSLKRPLVPPAWFEELPRQAIPEPTLVLLVLLHRDHDRLAGGSGGAVSG
jgi:hypothetical protein